MGYPISCTYTMHSSNNPLIRYKLIKIMDRYNNVIIKLNKLTVSDVFPCFINA